MDIQNKLFLFFWIFDFVAIVFLIAIGIKNRKKRQVEPLLKFANEHNSEISDYDAWDKTLIGIDKIESNRLFFMRKLPGGEIREIINLLEATGCRMFKTERKVKYDKETVNVTDRIELLFSFNNKPELSLEFYNTDYDQLTLSGELQLAQKWSDTIKRMIDTNKEQKYQKKELGNPVNKKPQINKVKTVKNGKDKKEVEKEYVV